MDVHIENIIKGLRFLRSSPDFEDLSEERKLDLLLFYKKVAILCITEVKQIEAQFDGFDILRKLKQEKV